MIMPVFISFFTIPAFLPQLNWIYDPAITPSKVHWVALYCIWQHWDPLPSSIQLNSYVFNTVHNTTSKTTSFLETANASPHTSCSGHFVIQIHIFQVQELSNRMNLIIKDVLHTDHPEFTTIDKLA